MKLSSHRRHPSGFVSYVLVLTTGAILTWLMIGAYRRALGSEQVQRQAQLRLDYHEKEETILRSIVAITPNRAIRAMQGGSDSANSVRNPLRWQNIFTEALVMANARTSIDANVATALSIPTLATANTGDSGLGTVKSIFSAGTPLFPAQAGFAVAGLDRDFGPGYPGALSCNDTTTTTKDSLYPIISAFKQHGSVTQRSVNLNVSQYPQFNLWKYPNIDFGYAQPGEWFVAKRNWWAFSMDVAAHDRAETYLASTGRDFVLSIYEIPSQLSISASSYMSLGQFRNGEEWGNVNIDGGLYVGKAVVESTSTPLAGLSSRRSMTLANDTTIGSKTFSNNPFEAGGQRDNYRLTEQGLFPVSLASESGRMAFIAINRGADFFDRFSQEDESNVLSSTSWNDYTIGARQCAMRLDVRKVRNANDPTPTILRFGYMKNSTTRAQSMDIVLSSTEIVSSLPAGYVRICSENQSYNLATLNGGKPVDVVYGESGGYASRQAVSGILTFNNATFGDPLVGTVKSGYWRPMAPFELGTANGQTCITVFPERLPAFLTRINGAGPDVNHSLAVNVDYSVSGLNNAAKYKPMNRENDLGLILKECANMTPFSRGFSLVTNLRTFIGDDFNTLKTRSSMRM